MCLFHNLCFCNRKEHCLKCECKKDNDCDDNRNKCDCKKPIDCLREKSCEHNDGCKCDCRCNCDD